MCLQLTVHQRKDLFTYLQTAKSGLFNRCVEKIFNAGSRHVLIKQSKSTVELLIDAFAAI